MTKIIGNIVGVPNPQPDFNQTDSTKANYIKNKPDHVKRSKFNQFYYYGDKDIVPSDESLFIFEETADKTGYIIRANSRLYDESVTEVVIPYEYNGKPVKEIRQTAFSSLHYVESVILPSSITVMGTSVFIDCKALKHIRLPESITEIKNDALRWTSLTNVCIPDKVERIGTTAFQGSKSLETITIPSSVKSIGSSAFLYCESLTDVHFQGSKSQWEKITIDRGNEALLNATIHFGECEGHGGSNDFVTKEEAEQFIEGINEVITDLPTKLFVEEKITDAIKGIEDGLSNESFDKLQYYGDINIIPSDASLFTFSVDDAKLTATITNSTASGKVVIPYHYKKDGKTYKVTKIGISAFPNNTEITEVIIPCIVKDVGYFYGCSNLKRVVLPDGITELSPFLDCYELTEINIPDTVTVLREEVFSNCYSLTEIKMPVSITNIEIRAFKDCPLENIYYEGSKAQWEAISKGIGSIPDDVKVHYKYTDVYGAIKQVLEDLDASEVEY